MEEERMSELEKRIGEIRSRLRAASKGPWAVGWECENQSSSVIVSRTAQRQQIAELPYPYDGWESTWQFIAHSITDVAYLLDEITRLRAVVCINEGKDEQ